MLVCFRYLTVILGTRGVKTCVLLFFSFLLSGFHDLSSFGDAQIELKLSLLLYKQVVYRQISFDGYLLYLPINPLIIYTTSFSEPSSSTRKRLHRQRTVY